MLAKPTIADAFAEYFAERDKLTPLTEIPQRCSSKFPTPGVPVPEHPNHCA